MTTVSEMSFRSQPAHGTIHWLNACIEKGKSSVFSEVVTLNPGLAAELLRRNEMNRCVRSVKSGQYAADIRSGRWVFNGEPIIISNTGELNDGQHRCSAVVEANISIPVLMVFGLPRESRMTVDQGAARTAGDYAGMAGVQNATQAASIARLVLAYERADGTSFNESSRITNAQVLARIHNDADIAAAATFATTQANSAKALASPAVIGLCFYVFSEINPIDAEMYLKQVCRGEGLKARDAAYAVRDRLINLATKSRDKRAHIIFRGWNAYRQGRTLGMVKIMGEDNLPALV